jgi:hypothetical protein
LLSKIFLCVLGDSAVSKGLGHTFLTL